MDWGYRSDGIPVQLFGAWTTLPAGPATLAAKTGAIIAPMAIRRTTGGRFRIEAPGSFTVPSSSPADLQRATQRIADALEDHRRRRAHAVVQLQADVAARTRPRPRTLEAGRAGDARRYAPDPAPSPVGRAADRGPARLVTGSGGACRPGGRGREHGLRGTLLLAATRLVGRPPRGTAGRRGRDASASCGTGSRPARAAQARANLRRVCEGLDAQGRGTRLARRAATDPDALELLVRRCFRHAVRYYLEVARIGQRGPPARPLDRVDVETPDDGPRGAASPAARS